MKICKRCGKGEHEMRFRPNRLSCDHCNYLRSAAYRQARRKKALRFTETDLQWMEAWYRDGYSTGQIAREWGCLMGSIWTRLKKRGVPLRAFNQRGKVGLVTHSQGYLMHRGRYVHRMVAEQILGRPLSEGEVVHHKNHNRTDNRPENLEILGSHGEHMRAHVAERRDPETGRFLPSKTWATTDRGAAYQAEGKGAAA